MTNTIHGVSLAEAKSVSCAAHRSCLRCKNNSVHLSLLERCWPKHPVPSCLFRRPIKHNQTIRLRVLGVLIYTLRAVPSPSPSLRRRRTEVARLGSEAEAECLVSGRRGLCLLLRNLGFVLWPSNIPLWGSRQRNMNPWLYDLFCYHFILHSIVLQCPNIHSCLVGLQWGDASKFSISTSTL